MNVRIGASLFAFLFAATAALAGPFGSGQSNSAKILTPATGGGGGGITSLNGSTDSVQSFATGTTGTAPAWVSSSGLHTLNIPFASASGTTAGLLSKAEYDALAPINNPSFTGTITTPLTASRVVKTTAGSAFTTGTVDISNASEATGTLPNSRGGTGGDSSAQTGLAKVAAGTWSYATLVNADVSTSAAIAHSKLANITAGSVLLGNGSNVPTATALSGDVTVNSSGVTAIASGVIVNADISGSAAIAQSKISQTGFVEDWHIYIKTAENETIPLIQKNRVARQVEKIALKCTSGTITAKLQIDGVDITTCTAISVSSTESDTTCDTGSTNNLSTDTTLTLVTSSNSSCVGLAASVQTSRD